MFRVFILGIKGRDTNSFFIVLSNSSESCLSRNPILMPKYFSRYFIFLLSSSGLIVYSAIWFWGVLLACNTALCRTLPIGGRLSRYASFRLLDLLLFTLCLLSWVFGDELKRFSLLGVELSDFLTVSSYWEAEDYKILSLGFLNGGESSEIIESSNGLVKLFECLFALATTADGWTGYFREDMCLILPKLSS